ncbi:MAG: type IX secretion system membrane protein PorP/SprF [Elusimicrobiota bacterium]|nr:type IX secretion system membrane protein PorP/SprF [Elusimicrobiota bacterium]
MRAPLAAVLVFLFAASAARAAFDENGAGARAPGMGDAFTALADDAYAIHYNPAGLAQLERPQFAAAYSKLYAGLSDGTDIGLSQLAYAHPLARGRHGALGVSWERFSLSGLYQEQSLAAAYGRQVLGGTQGGKLYLGATAKLLSRSFTRGDEASNACSGLNCSLGSDPVLSGSNSTSAPDLDLGLIYRFPRRLQAGLTLQHALRPNVAFAGTDKLERALNAGLAYKSLWMSLVGELKLRRAADGAMARDAIFAAERYFPSLDYGQFGVRGSLGIGSADWRQFTVGASYRINKIQADYAYLIPVGGVQGQSGSHRVGLSFHFGAPSADEELAQDLLEQSKRAREGLPAVSSAVPGFGYEYADQARPQNLSDPRLDSVRALILQRRYRAAKQDFDSLAKAQPLGPGLERLGSRLDDAAYHFAEFPEPSARPDKAIVDSIASYLDGDDRAALLHASYALALSGGDARVESLARTLEKKTGLKADRLPARHSRGFIDELLWRVEYAHTRGDAGQVESLLTDVIRLEPENTTALSRLGSQRYLAGRYLEAIQSWEAAEKIESRERELTSLRAYLKLAREAATGKEMPGGLAPAVAAPAAEPVELPRRASASPSPSGDPREVEGLYQKGVEHYARGEYLQASAMFLRILRIDPANAPARKALERIDRARPPK